LASSEPASIKDRAYTVILKSLPLDKLEEILLLIEKSIEEYLREKLTKYSDYTLIASISRSSASVDLVIDLRVDHCITPRDKCDDVVSDALNYAKRRIEEFLEDLSGKRGMSNKSF
jgi:hypothetical protein